MYKVVCSKDLDLKGTVITAESYLISFDKEKAMVRLGFPTDQEPEFRINNADEAAQVFEDVAFCLGVDKRLVLEYFCLQEIKEWDSSGFGEV